MKKLTVLLLALPLFGCAEKGSLEQLGEEIDESVEDIRNGGATLGNQIDDAVDEVRRDVEDAVE